MSEELRRKLIDITSGMYYSLKDGEYSFNDAEDRVVNEVIALITQELNKFAEEIARDVIGEDVPTPRPVPDFLIGDVYGVEANELRATQRTALTAKLDEWRQP